MPMPGPEFDSVEDPVVVIRDFLKRNSKDGWSPEEISEHTGLDMNTVFQLCQMLRAQYVEAAAKGDHFPVRSIERLGQMYFKWTPKSRKTKAAE